VNVKPSDSAREARRAVLGGFALIFSGAAIASLCAYGSMRLVAAAWDACDELEPPHAFGLFVVELPAHAITLLVLLVGAWWVGRRHSTALGVALALATAAVGFAVPTALRVPASNAPEFVDPIAEPYLAECGPGGIPTWWPTWLPT
jgi:hypothetical protein